MMLAPSPTSKLSHLNAALEALCFTLQLPDEFFESARRHYRQVGEWLTAPASSVRNHNPRVFHQGSMLLETTVRPYARTEYDLDVVCLLEARSTLSPRQAFDLVWKRMRESEEYQDRIHPKPRCIRLNFPDKFHLDIVPAVPDGLVTGTSLFVPDLPVPLERWKPSDPEGFAAWFRKQCQKPPKLLKFSHKAFLEASVDPIPDRTPYGRKWALQQAVQLVKRWRDKRFHGREELSTPSIVLTKLAADHYENEPGLYGTVRTILNGLHAQFAAGRPLVFNPVNPKELISERWEQKPQSFDAIKVGVAEFRTRWGELPSTGGVAAVANVLRDLFGDEAAAAVRGSLAPVEAAKGVGRLYMTRDARTLVPAPTPATIPVKGHTFYGE